MARSFELVKDINDTKEIWKVAVRVHHKWIVVSKNKEHFEMLLCDKENSELKKPKMNSMVSGTLSSFNDIKLVSSASNTSLKEDVAMCLIGTPHQT
ncbi:uncharacterized protein LOC131636142 isoform X2 [Vicia villosa]|uniref:uncharacterized protein LOC131636142 isoform X2 n=1 Tax=Vicia villosa TaxID=3911 RepID=UPI00273B5A86|nr:uncharacterized protein LOC131636142 isoform X2 [Vicia villosa]